MPWAIVINSRDCTQHMLNILHHFLSYYLYHPHSAPSSEKKIPFIPSRFLQCFSFYVSSNQPPLAQSFHRLFRSDAPLVPPPSPLSSLLPCPRALHTIGKWIPRSLTSPSSPPLLCSRERPTMETRTREDLSPPFLLIFVTHERIVTMWQCIFFF